MKKGFILVGILAIAFSSLVMSGCGESLRVERPLKQFTVSQGGVSGSFFLGCGAIGGDEKIYYFYYKTKSGNKFRPASADLRKISIIEDGQNKVVFIEDSQYFAHLHLREGFEKCIDDGKFFGVKEFEIHIPKDSILETYDPNLLSTSPGFLSVKRCIEKDKTGKCVKEEIITPGNSLE